MKTTMYPIYDSAAQAHLSPMFFHNDGIAIRWFSDGINNEDKQNNLFNHPEHFTLFKVGTFDDKLCQFELLDTPVSLGIGVGFKNPPTEVELIEELKKLLEDK